ncbi:MAG: methionyl-tRNA formyltransferase [Acidimicrobiales bacterium]
MNVLLVGEDSAGIQALRLVADRGPHLVGVLTGAGHGGGTSLAGAADQLDVPVLDAARVRDPGFAEWIRAHDVDLLLNVHSLYIVHDTVLGAPRLGCFNLHPGPLPRYAGLNAPSWAIYEGQRRHAVTLHWMLPEVDAGAIAYESWFDIAPDDTGLRVVVKGVRHGIPLIAQLLEDAARGADHVPARPQELDGRRWYGRGAPHDGQLPWHLPARRIVDLVRAGDYSPFPSPWGWPRATLAGRQLEFTRIAMTGEEVSAAPGTVGSAGQDGVLVAAADEWVRVHGMRTEGAPVAPAAALVSGQRFPITQTD